MRALLAFPLLASLVLATPASADFASCVAGLRSHAASNGISGTTFDSVMRGVEPDMKVLELMNNQPEFKTPVWDYLATLVDDQKVSEGRAALAKHSGTLARIEQAYGVDRHVVVAVWGIKVAVVEASAGRGRAQRWSALRRTERRRSRWFSRGGGGLSYRHGVGCYPHRAGVNNPVAAGSAVQQAVQGFIECEAASQACDAAGPARCRSQN